MNQHQNSNPMRILILGNGASGKSTLARTLSKALHYPILHLDSIYWKTSWKKYSKDEFIKIARRYSDKKQWIIEGTPRCDLEYRIKRATHILFLNTNTLTCLWRLSKRTLQNMFAKQKIDDGCPAKTISWTAIKWIIRFNHHRKPELSRICHAIAKDKLYYIKSLTDLKIIGISRDHSTQHKK